MTLFNVLSNNASNNLSNAATVCLVADLEELQVPDWFDDDVEDAMEM